MLGRKARVVLLELLGERPARSQKTLGVRGIAACHDARPDMSWLLVEAAVHIRFFENPYAIDLNPNKLLAVLIDLMAMVAFIPL